MNIETKETYEQISEKAAQLIARKVIELEEPVLGLATGSTPKGTYNKLVRYFEEGLVDFEDVISFNLDEYYPIEPTNPKSFTRYMKEKLFDRVNISDKNTHIPDGTVARKDLDRYCLRYEKKILEHGGIDLQLLGIGTNGHIGFNEPGSGFGTTTRRVKLTDETIDSNTDSPEELPNGAITMGIKSIMKSEQVLLLASGKEKAEAVERSVNGKITTEWPASILQLHPHVTFLLDEQAASCL